MGKKSGRRAVAEATVPYGIDPQQRLTAVVDVLGATRVAKILGVNASQPGRWKSGQERISTENQRKIMELEYVIGRLVTLMTPEVALDWLYGHNPWINGRPIDAMLLRGPLEISRAIDAEEQGAYF